MKYIFILIAALLVAGCDNPEAWSGGGSDNVSVDGEGNQVTIITSNANSSDEGVANIDQLNPDNSVTTTTGSEDECELSEETCAEMEE